MTAETSPLRLPFQGVLPVLSGGIEAGAHSAVLGRVKCGSGLVLGPHAVVRADGHFVRLGESVHLGARATVHIAHDIYPAVIGDRVEVGRNAVIHACTVGDDCVIEEDVVILDGSVVGPGTVIERGSVIYPRSSLEGGQVYAGRPARPVRPIGLDEVRERAAALRADTPAEETEAPEGAGGRSRGAPLFIAPTARLSGEIRLGEASSIWFSCELDAGEAEIVIGENANVQDNSVLRANGEAIVLGPESVVGHNVSMAHCRVGRRALVGIGAEVAAGTVIEDDVLLAAGAATEAGQILEKGWLWGGRPARALSRMDEAKRGLIAATISHYRGYAAEFASAAAHGRRSPLRSG